MKIKWNEKYNTIAVYVLIVAVLIISFYLFASKLEIFHINIISYLAPLRPIWTGLAFAYLLNLVMVKIETSPKLALEKRFPKPKSLRLVSMGITYLCFFVFIYLLLRFLLPQLFISIVGLVNSIQPAVTNLSDNFDKWLYGSNLSEIAIDKIIEKRDEFFDYTIRFAGSLVPFIKGVVLSTVEGIWNIVLGIIVSSYLLIEKEHFIAILRKMIATFSSKDRYDRIIYIGRLSNSIFQRFIGGKVIDSLIIGAITYALLLITGMPYTLLIAFIVTVTNVIPFFGPFIGAVPSFFIILFENPLKALWFIPLIFLIQQLDGNYIGPKILGGKLGVSPFWILFSLLVFGKLLGIVGLVIGVPLFMVIYELMKVWIDDKLKSKGLPTDFKFYLKDDL